jgi:hypothetical protein
MRLSKRRPVPDSKVLQKITFLGPNLSVRKPAIGAKIPSSTANREPARENQIGPPELLTIGLKKQT